jgi:hypothetical protein
MADESFEQKCTAVDMCPKCGGELDTGWECNKCGYDAMPHADIAKCGANLYGRRARNGGYSMSYVKPEGHEGNHEDSTGCWWS